MKPKPAPRFLRGAGFPYAGAALSRRFLLLLLQSLQIIRRSRFLQPEPGRSQKKEKVATDDEDRLGVPPTLFPKFMPMLRRSLSRFLSPKRRRKFINRRARGWVALFKRFMFSSKFMASAPPKPPDPPPAPPTPPAAAKAAALALQPPRRAVRPRRAGITSRALQTATI